MEVPDRRKSYGSHFTLVVHLLIFGPDRCGCMLRAVQEAVIHEITYSQGNCPPGMVLRSHPTLGPLRPAEVRLHGPV